MSNRGGEARALVKRSKGCCIHLHAPYSSCIMPSTSKDMATKSKMGHTITVGLSMLRVQRRNPPDGSEPPRTTRVRDEVTQGVATS
jgi:hypothetical protein